MVEKQGNYISSMVIKQTCSVVFTQKNSPNLTYWTNRQQGGTGNVKNNNNLMQYYSDKESPDVWSFKMGKY